MNICDNCECDKSLTDDIVCPICGCLNIDQLREIDNLYGIGEETYISDTQYDKVKAKTRIAYPRDTYFNGVGSTPSKNKVRLPYIMGSLNKTKLDGTCQDWLDTKGKNGVCVSNKEDGCSIFVEYNKGDVVFACTRGDGYEGQDITDKAKIFCDKPTSNGHFELRGEVCMDFDVCTELGYKHPRNAVAGILNRDGDKNCDRVFVKFYHLYTNEDECITSRQHFEEIELLGLRTPEWFCSLNITDVELSEIYKQTKETSLSPIDGLVITTELNHFENDYYPENTIAFKVNEDAVITKVNKVEWNVSRTGKLAPVVHVKEIDINGSTIKRVTGFNAKYIMDNGIGHGSMIGIVRSGDVIPYIDIIETRVKNPTIPTQCPSCGVDLCLSESGVDIMCMNFDCFDKKLYQVEHYLDSHGVEEMSYATLKLIGITDIRDLYNLHDFELIEMDGIGPKKASTILTQIQNTLKTSPDNLLRSFGINGIGRTASKDITDRWSLNELFTLRDEEFKQLDGIGDVLSKNLVNGLIDNKGLYEFLLSAGLTFKEQGDTLKGVYFTLTGKSDIKRNDLQKMIVEQGGMVKSVTKKTSYVVTNNITSKTGKMKKSHNYISKGQDIKIITYPELYELLGINEDM